MREGLAITRQSANAATLAADTAREALKISERAYVQIIPKSIPVASIRDGNSVHIDFGISNDGNTPALQMRSYTSAGVYSEPFPDELPAGGFCHPTTLNPMPNRAMMSCDTKPMAQAEIDKLLTDQIRLVVWGRVEYLDVFGISRFVNLRHYSFRDGEELSFTVAKNGNDSN